MASPKILKRDNSMFDIRGCPMYKCSVCSKRFQTTKIAETHMRRKHNE